MGKEQDIDISFAEIICTRFSHDMAGSISAVNNGVEFLLDSDDEMKEQALDLLQLSAKEGLAKLQLYRVAYGRVDKGANTSSEELKDIFGKFFENNKLDIKFSGDFTSGILAENRKLLANMVIAAASLMIYGGEMEINNGGNKISVSGKASKIKRDVDAETILADNNIVDVSPQNSQIILLSKLISDGGKKLKLEITDESLKLEVN